MQTDPTKLGPGQVLAGRYRIDRAIGEGGFGAVFAATELSLGRAVALKVLLPHLVAQADGLSRFRREAQLAQQLQHPNTVRLYEYGVTDDSTPFIAWELLKGQPLDSLLRKGPLPPARVVRIATQVLKSLMEAHGLGIVHRDIKPANIFLSDFSGEPDFVKVLDFGIAKGMPGQGQGHTTAGLTQAGQSLGTPSYMSPEQITGAVTSPAGDLYALGLVMAEALTGEVVFQGESGIQIAVAQISNDPAPLKPEVLRSPLGPIIHRATQKSLDRRYTSAAEMLKDVEELSRSGAGLQGAAAAPAHAMASAAPATGHAALAMAGPQGGQAMAAPGQSGYAQTHAASYAGPFAGSTAPPGAYAPQHQGMQYPGPMHAHSMAPYQPPRASSGASTGMILAIVGGVVVLLGGVMVILIAVGISVGASEVESPRGAAGGAGEAPTFTQGFEELTKDDVRRKVEGEGWKVVSESETKSDGFTMVFFTLQQQSRFGSVQLYHYNDETMAQAVADAMRQNATGVTAHDGGSILFVMVDKDLGSARKLLNRLGGR